MKLPPTRQYVISRCRHKIQTLCDFSRYRLVRSKTLRSCSIKLRSRCYPSQGCRRPSNRQGWRRASVFHRRKPPRRRHLGGALGKVYALAKLEKELNSEDQKAIRWLRSGIDELAPDEGPIVRAIGPSSAVILRGVAARMTPSKMEAASTSLSTFPEDWPDAQDLLLQQMDGHGKPEVACLPARRTYCTFSQTPALPSAVMA
jgi:hypothetical protein